MSKMKKFFQKMHKRMFSSSNHIKNNPNVIEAKESAPDMGFSQKIREIENPREILGSRRKMFSPKIMLSMIKETGKAKNTLKKNPIEPKKNAPKELFHELENYAASLELKIGYSKLRQELIFKDQVVLYDNAIVLSMEMDKEKIDMAPSLETGRMVIETYNELGIKTNKIAEFLRRKGFSAQASHPLGGAFSYPPLALLAGMGWIGRHGLLISPDFGPRHRLAAVLTNITNLPYLEKNPHEWIQEYCSTCGRCIRTCSAEAIYEKPVTQEDGRKTHIDIDKCFPEFSAQYGCSVCIKECMFNRVGYEKLREQHNKK